MHTKYLFATALLLSFLPTQSFAQTTATATTDVNMRSGPGPEHPVIGHIRNRERIVVIGCIEGSLWCHVRQRGREGWAYSQYLAISSAGTRVVVTERRDPPPPVVTYRAPEVTLAPPAFAAAPVDRPLEAFASAYPPAVEPPAGVRTYVVTNPVDPIYLDGDAVIGTGLPPAVSLYPLPNYRYRYVYVGSQPVLVDPATRRIVYIYR